VFSANFVALVVAAVSGWRLNDLITLYWLELVALAGITIYQVRRATRAGTFGKSLGYITILFVTHYGTFCVLYRAIMIRIFGADAVAANWYWLIVWLPLTALVTAHWLSLRRDYLPHQAAALSPYDAMWIPYLRELPVHIPLLIAIAVFHPDTSARFVVLFFGTVKLLLDVGAHVLYHTRIARVAS